MEHETLESLGVMKMWTLIGSNKVGVNMRAFNEDMVFLSVAII